LRIATFICIALSLGVIRMGEAQDLGIIGETKEDGLPVIFKFVDELPNQETRQKFRWLTVISWKYDRSIRNGMPPDSTNKQMIALEDAIDELEKAALCRHAYSRTGNGLKELVYYLSDRDQFMAAFNNALREHPRYPLEIKFYEDEKWEDFQNVRGRFKRN
jgi:Family of unknown function (DUF695)